MKTKSVMVKVPASTSNLGSGFDTLGLAVNLYNRICVAAVASQGVQITSPVADEDRAGATVMLAEAAELFFRRTRTPAFGIDVSLRGNIPIARGLGYSATVRVGLLAALHELTGTRWDRQQLLDLAVQLEHHPDNASPALFGGFTVSGTVGKTVRCLRFPVSSKAKFVTLFPNFKVSTQQARTLVPAAFSKMDTVHGLNRAALITAAFSTGNFEALRGLFDDRLHQPYREPLIPQLSRVIRAGERAGAMGGWLSGSGSAIMCVTLENADAVACAMQKELRDSEVKILKADNQGLKIE